MRNLKKLASLLLALAMVFSLATTAFAAEETYSITINNNATGHIYEAYQIFAGDLSGNAENDAANGTNAVLSNIVWGDSVANAADLGSAAVYAEALANGDKTLEDLTEEVVLGNPVANSGSTCNPYVISGLDAGYYLIKDQDDTLNGKDDSYTQFILEVVENSTVSPKSSVPQIQKKVKDINDSTETELSDWQDSADHDIGDDVPFQLKATLANNVSAYDTYKIIFHDTLSAGLTYNGDAKVYFEGNDVTAHFTVTEANGNLTVTCKDVKAFGASDSDVITVEYTAVLNENAVLGSAGNPNVVYLEYSNNPNWDADGWDKDGDGEKDDDEESPEDWEKDEPTGETPEDKVIVFTYKTVINKVDAQGEALSGAEFKLEKYDETTDAWEEVDVVVNEAGTVFTFTGLDDGLYCLTETVTPAGYNSIDPIYFQVTAEHEVLADDPHLTALDATETNADGSDLESGSVGSFNVTHDLAAGSLTSDVVNNAGIVLPETGGMGTTLFYVFGAILVLAAVVLLVTKRRMAV